jgi:hypothetical protein
VIRVGTGEVNPLYLRSFFGGPQSGLRYGHCLWSLVLEKLARILSVLPFSLIFSLSAAWATTQAPVQPDLGIFGWEANQDAAIAYQDGSFFVRDGRNLMIHFGIADGIQSLNWYNQAGYLPALVTEFDKNSLHVKIMNFADELGVSSADYVVAYSRVTITNPGEQPQNYDLGVPSELAALGETASSPVQGSLEARASLSFDFAIMLDRFGQKSVALDASALRAAGSLDLHFEHMRNYWDARLAEIAKLSTPREDVNNAYKAGFIYTQISRDGYKLKPGNNGYDTVYDHDAQGIAAALFTMGDFRIARPLLDVLPREISYEDGNWHYPWAWAVYLLKTGDAEFVEKYWSRLKQAAQKITKDRKGPHGIMKKSDDIDDKGYWVVDNWSGLVGLASFGYLAQKLGHADDAKWASDQYSGLEEASENELLGTIKKYKLTYLPISMTESNDANRASNPTDANWASFGSGLWELSLLNGKLSESITNAIEPTLTYGFSRLAQAGLPPHTFGGFPGYSSAYNASYAEPGLLTDKYRDEPIRAYEFLLENAQSGPLSFWEGIANPAPSTWVGIHPKGGTGDCPHIWGQSLDMTAVLDSIIAEKFDGSLSVGRGIPEEWLTSGQVTELQNFPVSAGRIGVTIAEPEQGIYTLQLSGSRPSEPIYFELPSFGGKRFQILPGQRSLKVDLRAIN